MNDRIAWRMALPTSRGAQCESTARLWSASLSASLAAAGAPREAVRNAFRHAQALHIEAEISYGERALRVRVRDYGRGIDPAVVEEGRTGHYGLPGMRERAKRIGAGLNVWSGVGSGTEVELEVPGVIAYGTGPARGRWWWRRKKEQD